LALPLFAGGRFTHEIFRLDVFSYPIKFGSRSVKGWCTVHEDHGCKKCGQLNSACLCWGRCDLSVPFYCATLAFRSICPLNGRQYILAVATSPIPKAKDSLRTDRLGGVLAQNLTLFAREKRKKLYLFYCLFVIS